MNSDDLNCQSAARCDQGLRDAAIEYLLGRINYERIVSPPYAERFLKLDRMRNLLLRLGNPDSGMPIVHIAGTKGKGSTSAMLASILHASGLDVGVFSSPHLNRLEERFSVNGLPCPDAELVALVSQLKPIVSQMDGDADASANAQLRPTFFEIITAIALMHFAQQRVDVAILEVGLGGRLDSTNVCQPAVSVITSISHDHTKQLGSELSQIAAEKAGIIKPGAPVIAGRLPREARDVVAEIARQRGARMIEAGRDFDHCYCPPERLDEVAALGSLEFESRQPPNSLAIKAPLRMLGARQADNAATALAAALELKRQGWMISREAMRNGLAHASLPGRMEILSRRPTTVLDVAHNVAAAEALIECLQTCFAAKRRVLVFAGTRDKDLAGMARVLAPHFDRVVLTEYTDNDRAACADEMLAIWRSTLATGSVADASEPAGDVFVRQDPLAAWRLAMELARTDDVLCVTGSFFIAAQLRPRIIRDAVAVGLHA